MKLLVLGGTVFLGRAVVEEALARGHEVTIFTRGQHNPDLFTEVERLHGDRNGNLAALKGHNWDAVIDTSGYVPRIVRASTELLADQVGHYTFVSSLSVYSDLATDRVDESWPVGTLEDESNEEVTGETYGPLKALCERAAEEAMPGRALAVRAGLIVGPHDRSDRFTYWPHRVAEGREVLAPGRPQRSVQFIDVRDLAGWMVRMAERRGTGVFNATGPERPMPMGELLSVVREGTNSDAEFTWVSEDFLLAHGVEPWMELPLWIPESDPALRGFHAVDCSRAMEHGLSFTPLVDTVRDTLAWDREHANREWRAGMERKREQELLKEWHASRGHGLATWREDG